MHGPGCSMRRFGLLFALVFFLGACGADPDDSDRPSRPSEKPNEPEEPGEPEPEEPKEPEQPAFGGIRVRIEGLRPFARPGLILRGPEHFEVVLEGDATFKNVRTGDYTLTGTAFKDDSFVYTPVDETLSFEVEEGRTAEVDYVFTSEQRKLATIAADGVVMSLIGEADLPVTLTRGDGYEGPVRVELAEAPGGVTAEAIEIPAGETSAVLHLRSDGSALVLGKQSLRLRARANETETYAETYVEFRLDFDGLEPEPLLELLRYAVRNAGALAEDGSLRIVLPRWEDGLTLFLGDPLELVDDVHLVLEAEADEEPWLVFDGDGQSSLFRVMKGTLELRGMVLQNGHAEDGGAIENHAALRLVNVVLRSNTATHRGGAVFAGEGSRTEILDSRILENQAEDTGGAVHAQGRLTVIRGLFERNRTQHNGGAIHADEATLEDVQFVANVAHGIAGDGLGGAVWARLLVVRKGALQDNEARYQGGGVYADEEARLTEVEFSGNRAENGGAIAASALTLYDGKFSANQASWSGGAIWVGSATMEEVQFFENVAEVSAGAVGGTEVSVVGGLFARNGSGVMAGAVAGDVVTLESVHFIENAAASEYDTFGGAVVGEVVNVKDGTFADNWAWSWSASAFGGAIDGDFVALTDVHFDGNGAGANNAYGYGGAIVAWERLTIERGVLENNEAWGWGGAIDSWKEATLVDTRVTRNVADRAGGVSASGSLRLERCLVDQNIAYERGGGIHADGVATIFNSTLTANVANDSGGAIAFTGASENDHLRIVQSTVSGNDAWWARGILLSGDQVRFVLDRSILAYHGGPDIASEATSLMHENHGYNLVGSVDDLPGFAHPTDLIGIDPGLSALAQHGGLFPSVAPSPTSPVVDHVPVAACLDLDGDPLLVDQRGFPRPAGAGCDIGAFEVQSGP